jgi:hypothetical protein
LRGSVTLQGLVLIPLLIVFSAKRLCFERRGQPEAAQRGTVSRDGDTQLSRRADILSGERLLFVVLHWRRATRSVHP